MKARLLLLTFAAAALSAQNIGSSQVTSPREELGFNLGDDYQVANYTQLERYWRKLASESNRMKLEDIGLTAEGRHQYMAVITSAENQKKLDHYKDISRRLGLAEGLTDEQAHALAREGKSVIFMDGGLHATETVGSQALMELVYQMVSRTDPETMRFLNDDIMLLCLANPDGQELVANWYMREKDETKRTMNGLPRLWQKYIGHDNARDMFMSNMPETENINRVLFIEWFPQITHTHHQTGPAGAVVFMPPFRDPFNYNFDPLVVEGVNLVGAAMHSRLIAAGMPGSAERGASNYSTWWNGGMRTISYFHNMIGLLTEIIGSPTPMEIPLVLDRQLPNGNEPFPDRAAEVALSPVDRLRDGVQPRGVRRGFEISRDVSLQHLSDGQERHRPREPRLLDHHAEKNHRGAGGGDEARAGARSRRGQRWRRNFLRPSTKRCCTIRRCATRAGMCFPPINPISPPYRSSSTFCLRMASRCGRRPRLFRSTARPIQPIPTSSRPRRRRARSSWTCSSRRITPTIFATLEARRILRTTSPDGRSRFKWACSSTGFSTASTARSQRSPRLEQPVARCDQRCIESGRISDQPSHQ